MKQFCLVFVILLYTSLLWTVRSQDLNAIQIEPFIEIETDDHNFGDIDRGDTAICRINYKNTGLNPLIIKRKIDKKFDFGYSLGVLHHIPNTSKALNDCVFN